MKLRSLFVGGASLLVVSLVMGIGALIAATMPLLLPAQTDAELSDPTS